jgi:hypothetical protein
MTSQLPEDVNGNPIPTLRLKENGANQISVTATSAKNIAAFDAQTDVIGFYSTQDIFIKIGDSSIAATTSDHFLPANNYFDLTLGPNDSAQNSYLAALSTAGNGILYISEKM